MQQNSIKKNREKIVSRRNCLKLMGAFGLGLAAPTIIAKQAEGKHLDNLHSISKTRPLMGTIVTITIADSSRDKAEKNIEKAFVKMTELEKIFNRHADNTPVSRLNQKGLLKDISPELADVLHQSAFYNYISKGTFDITVLPVLELYKKSYESTGYSPSQKQINEKMKLVNFENIKIDKEGVRLLKDGMQISLDGIAKGYIVDQAANLIKLNGIKYALINAGGDVRVIGGNGPGKAWKIGIKDPLEKKEVTELFELNNGAVATSGNYENYFDKDKIHHHIIDTSTGDSPVQTISATVLAPTVMQADALSTSLFIHTPKNSIILAGSLSNIEALIIAKGGRKYRSSGWNNITK
ncbi:MAG: FAD:protein FMN transferase [Deltaproteobacteria bacterium]|nr:FAD:protein FMN transferase [Deltaproteobacteria bacterium]MBW2166677.1 FAD:protein FMN transferase [Deltaproteobacteria bacterium]